MWHFGRNFFSHKKIFPKIFRQPKIYGGQLPLFFCRDATAGNSKDIAHFLENDVCGKAY